MESHSDEKFRIVNVEMDELYESGEHPGDPIIMDDEDDISYETEKRRSRRRNKKAKPKKEPHYGWAFFLCSFFIGLGVSLGISTHGPPVFMFIGMGIGFLFFVEPIYKKMINWITNL